MTGRRRTPGLRREEVAQLAGLSVDYYTRLEQARDLQPSAPVVEALARALQLAVAERDHLFRLARMEPARRRASSSQNVRPTVQRVLDALEPNPALMVSHRMDILAWNRPCASLVTDFALLAPPERNLGVLIFLDPRSREIYPNWDHVAQDGVACLRAAVGRHPDDRLLHGLVDRLSAHSAPFRLFWGQQEIQEKTVGSKDFAHPALGRFTLDYEALTIPETDHQLIVYTAPDGSAAQATIELLASVPART